MRQKELKPLVFIGSARKDIRAFPLPVREDIGFELYQVQIGRTPESAKSFKGLPGVMELVERYDKDTYRAVYLANLGGTVNVLHCFKKKSKKGIKTPKEDIEVIRKRFKQALELIKAKNYD